MSDDPDFEYLIVDSTVVRAHQPVPGPKRGLTIRRLAVRAGAEHQDTLGRSRPGNDPSRVLKYLLDKHLYAQRLHRQVND